MKKLKKKVASTELDAQELEIVETGISNWRIRNCPSFANLSNYVSNYVELFARFGKPDESVPRGWVEPDAGGLVDRIAFWENHGLHALAGVETHLRDCALCKDDVVSLSGLHLAIQKSLPEIKRLPLRERIRRFLAERKEASERVARVAAEREIKEEILRSINDDVRGKR